MSEETFVEWLNRKKETKGWSMRELSRRMNVSHTTVADVVNGKREPTFDFCISAARVMDEPEETVLRRAGLLPSVSDNDTTFKQILELVQGMNIDQRAELLDYALFKFRKRK